MIKRNIIKKDKHVALLMSQAEFDSIRASQQSSNFPSMSGFLLQKIRDRKITIMVRNRSQDDILQEISRIRKSLEGIYMQSDFLSSAPLEQNQGTQRPPIELSNLVKQLNNKLDKLLNLWLP